MVYIEVIGFAAGTLTTIALIPQVIKAWKTKLTRDVSFSWIAILNVGILLWLIYGVLIVSWPLILSNIFSLILAFSILVLKMKHG